MFGNTFRKQKVARDSSGFRSMATEDAFEHLAGVIRPRAAFSAEQFFLENAEGGSSREKLIMAVGAMRATVEDQVLEWCNLSRLRRRERTDLIAGLQQVGVNAFLGRFKALRCNDVTFLKSRPETHQ